MARVWDCFLTLSQGKMVFSDPSTSPGGSLPEPWGLKCSLASPFLCLSAWEKMRAGCHVFSTTPAASLLQVCTLRKAFSESPVEIHGEEPAGGVNLNPTSCRGSQGPYSFMRAYTSL